MSTIRVLVVDDHAIVRTGLIALLESWPEMEVVGEADDGEIAVRKVRELKPDVVVMDILMPIKDGIAATREIKADQSGTKVLILTTSTVSDELANALAAGADGAIPKSTANRTLISTIRRVAEGKRAVANEIEKMIANDPPSDPLTPRQIEILASIARGLTDRDIAKELGIRLDGVNGHVRSILKRLHAANRTEAVSIALRKRLINIH